MNSLKGVLLVDDSALDTELTLNAFAAYNLANEVVALRECVEVPNCLYRRGEFAGRTDAHAATVLSDLKMPSVDGLEVQRQSKGDPELKVIPVVVMTSIAT